MILKPRLFRKPNLSHPLSKGLVGCWLMNEGSGNTVQDLSGNGNHGTLTNCTWVAGKYGPCVDTSNAAASIVIPNTLQLTSDLSAVTFIVYAENNDATCGANDEYLINCLGALDDSYSLLWESSGVDDAFYFQLLDAGLGDVTLVTNKLMQDTNWHQFAASYDGATMRFYQDAIVDSTTAAQTGNINDNGHDICFGCYSVGISGYNWDGRISHILIYNRALSASEVSQLYREPFRMFRRDPIELWSAATQGGGAPPVGNAGIMTCNTGYWGATY